jgi:hypothetical protein
MFAQAGAERQREDDVFAVAALAVTFSAARSSSVSVRGGAEWRQHRQASTTNDSRRRGAQGRAAGADSGLNAAACRARGQVDLETLHRLLTKVPVLTDDRLVTYRYDLEPVPR